MSLNACVFSKKNGKYISSPSASLPSDTLLKIVQSLSSFLSKYFLHRALNSSTEGLFLGINDPLLRLNVLIEDNEDCVFSSKNLIDSIVVSKNSILIGDLYIGV